MQDISRTTSHPCLLGYTTARAERVPSEKAALEDGRLTYEGNCQALRVHGLQLVQGLALGLALELADRSRGRRS